MNPGKRITAVALALILGAVLSFGGQLSVMAAVGPEESSPLHASIGRSLNAAADVTLRLGYSTDLAEAFEDLRMDPASVRSLTIVGGQLSEEDFHWLRNNMSETLEELNIDASATEQNKLADRAFSGMIALRTVRLTDSVYEVGEQAFFGCTSLVSVNLQNATILGAGVFESCKSLVDISLPSVTSLPDRAFLFCESLEQVDIPILTDIGAYTFGFCSSLRSLGISHVTAIGRGAFAACRSLSDIAPSDLVRMGRALAAFSDYALPEDSQLICLTAISDYIFNDYDTDASSDSSQMQS